jgi:hypothetical protein
VITVVLHGARRPPDGVLVSLRQSLAHECGADTEVLEAFEAGRTARGAAALVDDALGRARGDVAVVLASDAQGETAPVRPLIEALARGAGMVLADTAMKVGRWRQVGATRDLMQAIAEDVAPVFEGKPAAAQPAFVCAWAAPANLLREAGGLDARWRHSGEALDLALRVLDLGQPVECVADKGPPGRTVYPLPAPVAHFLAWKHAAGIALSRPDADQAGRLSAWVAAQALARAWHTAGLDPRLLTFGGNWARQAWQDRWTGRAGLRRNDLLWPRDEAGTVLPILALDAALDDLVEAARVGTLRTVPRRPSSPSTPASREETASARSATPRDTAIAQAGMRSEEPAAEAGGASPAARPPEARPLVSVIVVNWNGVQHLTDCFASLQACDYPADRLELICVDNGSSDGSRELLAARFPAVKVVALAENRGFTGGNVAGVNAARGEILAFFNNDMRIAPDAISRLVAAIDARHPCSAARVLSWDGQRIDFVRGTLSFEARGFQEFYGEPARAELSAAGESFFPNGGAFAITRDAYDRAGGFDPAFFAYYDDTDLGWGVRLNGGHIRVVPEALAYHRHSATTNRWPHGQKQFLMERNAVWAAVKRYGEDALTRTLGPMLLLAARRVAQDAGVDASSALGLALRPHSARVRGRRAATGLVYSAGTPDEGGFLQRLPLESVAALGEAVRGLGRFVPARRAIQEARTAAERDLLSRFGRSLEYLSSRKTYRDAQDALVARFGLEGVFRARSRVLIVTHDPLRANMSGPGVRVLELGRALAATCDVTLATPFAPEIRDDRCRIAQYSFGHPASMGSLAEQADVIVVQGFTLSRFPVLTRLPSQIVVDLYCPFTIEHLEMRTSAVSDAPGTASALPPETIHAEAVGILEAMNEQLRLGDFFLCASERQRDYWVGALQTAGRINALTYADDPTLRALIDVVPFGLPDEPPPAKAKRVMKGVIPGIAEGDRVILWAGSLLDWQDPQGLIQAVARVVASRPDVKLVFMGTRHPNPDVPLQRAVEESVELARRLGLLDRHVFFNPWVPYADRHEWLLEADLGVTTHRDHLETRFAYRTRMLDYVWAGLPVVCTRGDVFADLVEQHALGRTVPPGDEAALASALGDLLDDAGARAESSARLRILAEKMRWSQVVEPLRRFCEAPRHAADRAPGMRAVRTRLEQKYRMSKWMKRVALRAGVSEGRIEQIKQVEPVRSALIWRNRVAFRRAQRGK